ncbi:MAG: hypothetical protein HQK61_05810 [Desulfamplus sp.]|nr:hypothetical protein [Desulfamplus sp.]
METAFPDAFEIDDTPADAQYFNHNAIYFQMHNFHKEGDADWIAFSALKSDVAIEIKTYDPGPDCETVIGLYGTDGITLILPESRQSLSDGTHLVSWRPVADGTYYVKITNKDSALYGRNAYYKLWIYKPVMSTVAGRIDGVVTDASSGQRLEGVLVSTPFDEVRSTQKGFYYIACPAGEISFVADKIGYQKFHTMVSMGEDQRIQINIALTPSYSYSSTYTLSQWGTRGSDTNYCLDICDLNGNPYPGLEDVVCGENLHAWSAKEYINITLGVPDTLLSGFQFMWKVSSPAGYGGEGFEGVISVP